MKHTNGTRRPEEIEADIERTRSELNRTLSAIEQRLSPGQLVDQGLEYLRSNSVREYASNLGTAAKQDPLPLALVGVGLAWLMVSSRRGHDPVATVHTTDHPGAMTSMKDKVTSASQRVSGKVTGASQRVSQSAQAARERAGQVSESARYQAQRLRSGYDRMVEEQPLALGAIGLAIGAVLAAGAPRTRTEERWVTGSESPPGETDRGTGYGGSTDADYSPAQRDEARQAGQSAADAVRYGRHHDGDHELGRTETSGGDAVVVDDEPRPSVQPYAPYVPPVR